MRRVIAIAAAVVMCTMTGVPTAAAQDRTETTEAEQHCVWNVERLPSDELVPRSETCFATFSEAMASIGEEVDTPQELARLRAERAEATSLRQGAQTQQVLASTTIGVHFTNQNYYGNSLTIVGGICNGGYVNLTMHYTAFNDDIESSFNDCYFQVPRRVTHYYDYAVHGGSCLYVAGSVYTTTNAMDSSFGWLNNKISCIRYGGSA